MFVCGGLTTCCSVCSGVVIVARKRCNRAGRHLLNALRSPRATAGLAAAEAALTAARSVGRRPPCAPPNWIPAFGEARLHLRELGRGRPLDLPVDAELLAAGLDLRDDLRHRPRLVHGGEHEAARDRRHARHLRDLRRRALGEGQLRARQEEVVDELLAGLAELREVRDHRLVRLDHLAAAAAEATATEAAALPQRPGSAARASRSGRCRCSRADRAPSPAPRRARARAPTPRSRARRRRPARARSGSSGSCAGRARCAGSRGRTSE